MKNIGIKIMQKQSIQKLPANLFKLIRTATITHALLTVVAVGVVVFLLAATAYASTIISRTYKTDEEPPIGSIVSLAEDTDDEVKLSTAENADNMVGVVANENHSMISLSGMQEDEVPIATDGTFDVLVSDINGEVNRGDHIAASPIAGIGMQATSNTRVVGIAQRDLTIDNGEVDTYTDAEGQEHEVLLGEVPAMINVAHYFVEPEQTIIPAAIQEISNAIAGRHVEPLPIIISSIIFIVTLIAVASIIFSMIRSSIISVGRNPMSQPAVYRNVIQLTALVLGILSVATVSIYLILTGL